MNVKRYSLKCRSGSTRRKAQLDVGKHSRIGATVPCVFDRGRQSRHRALCSRGSNGTRRVRAWTGGNGRSLHLVLDRVANCEKIRHAACTIVCSAGVLYGLGDNPKGRHGQVGAHEPAHERIVARLDTRVCVLPIVGIEQVDLEKHGRLALAWLQRKGQNGWTAHDSLVSARVGSVIVGCDGNCWVSSCTLIITGCRKCPEDCHDRTRPRWLDAKVDDLHFGNRHELHAALVADVGWIAGEGLDEVVDGRHFEDLDTRRGRDQRCGHGRGLGQIDKS